MRPPGWLFRLYSPQQRLQYLWFLDALTLSIGCPHCSHHEFVVGGRGGSGEGAAVWPGVLGRSRWAGDFAPAVRLHLLLVLSGLAGGWAACLPHMTVVCSLAITPRTVTVSKS